ncbi:MAG: TlpA disulfide reductase family protein [Acidobacteriota bacterium]
MEALTHAVVLAVAGLLGTPAAMGASEATDPSIWQAEEWTDLEGYSWTASELEGRVVLLDFWATWCPPCLAELPQLRALHEDRQDDGLLIVGIALDAIDRRGLRSFLLRHGIEWPQVHRPDGLRSEVARRFGVDALPVTVLVDRRGRVVARNLRGEALARVVDSLIQFER